MTARDGADRCPGVLRPFAADDGAIIRLRVPGGQVAVRALTDLVAVAARHGAPGVHLTSRAAVQLRALPDPLPADAVAAIDAAGLLAAASHERARSILAAPLNADLQPLVGELDAAIQATPQLADLPGRFLWALSDATGSVLTEPWDLAYQRLDADHGLLLVADHALEVGPRDAVTALIDRALRFLAERADERIWNVRDLPPGSPVLQGMRAHRRVDAVPLLPGPAGADLVVGVPLGLLRGQHVQALAEVSDEVTLTPWRSLVIRGGAGLTARLDAAGLTVSADSPWARLSACVGAPSCRRTTTATLGLAAAAAAHLDGPGPRIHVVGCERACGRPTGDPVTVIAPRRVEDVLAAADAP